jgi:hypothetical protein
MWRADGSIEVVDEARPGAGTLALTASSAPSDEGRARWRSEDLHPACEHHESIDDCIERDGGGPSGPMLNLRRTVSRDAE